MVTVGYFCGPKQLTLKNFEIQKMQLHSFQQRE